MHIIVAKEIEYIEKYSKIYKLTNSTKGGEYYAIGSPVNRYTLSGEYIDTYTSMIEACECLGFNKNTVSGISACCVKKRNFCKGFMWSYSSDKLLKEDIDKCKKIVT